MTKKITKKDLKEDKLLNIVLTGIDYLKNNKISAKKILYAIGAICLILFVAYSYVKGQKQEAETLYREALRIYQESSNEEGYKEAKDTFKKALKFKRTRAGKLAFLYAGNCCYKLKEYQEALKHYKSFVQNFDEYPLIALGFVSLANTAEDLDNFQEAINSYKELIRNYPQSSLVPYAKIRLAKCYEEIKNIKEAKKVLKKVIEEYPDTKWKFIASFYLNIMKEAN
ncbi:MAG: tetratricopeptide repeat protein [bacterium]|nr:tetratricopeptide repeat protein [bacterium]